MKKKVGAPPRPTLNLGCYDDNAAVLRGEDGIICSALDFRLPPPPWSADDIMMMIHHLARLRVDPTHTNYVAVESSIVISIACNAMPEVFDVVDFESNADHLGQRVFELLANENHDTMEQVFSDILRMKKEADNPPSRNYFAYLAYCHLTKKKGVDPTKNELRKYIIANRSTYREAPSDSDGKGWTRLWQSACLTHLDQG